MYELTCATEPPHLHVLTFTWLHACGHATVRLQFDGSRQLPQQPVQAWASLNPERLRPVHRTQVRTFTAPARRYERAKEVRSVIGGPVLPSRAELLEQITLAWPALRGACEAAATTPVVRHFGGPHTPQVYLPDRSTLSGLHPDPLTAALAALCALPAALNQDDATFCGRSWSLSYRTRTAVFAPRVTLLTEEEFNQGVLSDPSLTRPYVAWLDLRQPAPMRAYGASLLEALGERSAAQTLRAPDGHRLLRSSAALEALATLAPHLDLPGATGLITRRGHPEGVRRFAVSAQPARWLPEQPIP